MKMNAEQLQNEAKIAAAKHVANMIQRPDQLEKVEQYKRRIVRKKASVEAMLKTAVQSQLDGVVSGLQQLQSSLHDITDIREKLKEIEDVLRPLPTLSENIKQVRQEHSVHSQYAVAMENLKHIFNVPESIEKTRQWISEGKLLHAHQSLMDLENSRDDLLFELHRLPSHSDQDKQNKQTLQAYFSGVQRLSEDLGKQLWVILGRLLNTVRKEPQVVVTALRIIEREERADAYALQREKQTGFMPPGRPKKWKEHAVKVLSNSVIQRIEGNQFEERSDNKMWLVRHLEVTRMLVIEDLRVVKTLCSPCFPPSWDVVDQYVKMYHANIRKHLEEVKVAGLVGNEYVTLLSWVLKTYQGPELLQHPDLAIDPASLGALLSDETIDDLLMAYLDNMRNNYEEWMQRTLETEARDWRREQMPESDSSGYYSTEAIVIIFQMVEQNLQVSQTVSDDLMLRALGLALEQIVQFGALYRNGIIAFKTKYFEDRNQVPYFTHYMIAIANNCLRAIELAQQIKTRYSRGDKNVAIKFENLCQTYESLRMEAANYLLEEALLDMEPHFNELMSRKWVTSSVPIDTVCITLDDYFNDYSHLMPRNLEHMIREAGLCLSRKYLISVFQKKPTFREERRDAAEKIIREAGQIASLLARASTSLSTPLPSEDGPHEAIAAMAEIIKCDLDMLRLDLHTFVKKYPDVSHDQLVCLLNARGDIGWLDARNYATDVLADCANDRGTKSTMFSQILVPSSMF